MIVLDTHALIWWINADAARLSGAAKQAIEAALSGDGLVASAISAWEIAMLVAKGRLELTMDVERWLDLASAIEGFRFVPIDVGQAVRSVNLPGAFHPDPADRFIVALALELDAPLVTADARISAYPRVRTIW